MSDNNLVERFNNLKKGFEDAKIRLAKAETSLEESESRYKELLDLAKEKYNVDSIDGLVEKIKSMKVEMEGIIEGIEKDLKNLDNGD